jgi:hypothetical protein
MSSSFPVDFAGPVEELPPYDPEGFQAVAVFWNAKKAAFLV